jgi:outer membrane protein, heavy metal efflux system
MKLTTSSLGHRPMGIAWLALAMSALLLLATSTSAQPAPGAIQVTLDEAIKIALLRNHNLRATRTTIPQSEADEITASLRPNPTLSATWGNLPLYPKPSEGYGANVRDSSQMDVGLSYEFELGRRARRMRAAKDATAVTRSQVAQSERDLTFQVTSQFVNVQLAESTLELAKANLESFQKVVDISAKRLKAGGISENDYLKIKLELLSFETDVKQAELDKAQALTDLRQLLGYESVSSDYDVQGSFEHKPFKVSLETLEKQALQNRPDLRAAVQSLTAANSQHALAKANGVPNITASVDWLFSGGVHAAAIGLSIPIPMFDRNQGEVAKTTHAMNQAQEQQAEVLGQVMTDVKRAYDGLRASERIMQYFESGYLEVSLKSREVSQYSYERGAASLLDFLDSERSYRSTQLAYRQAIADYLNAVEQVRQAVGRRDIH